MYPYYLTKEAELNAAILLYATRCAAEGDLQMLAALGFERCDVETLRKISLGDLHHLAGIKGHMLKPCIDRVTFYQVMTYMEKSKDTENLIDYFLKNDASIIMMQTLFGLSNSEVADRRRLLGVEGRVGRTREASPDEELAVWNAFKEIGKDDISHLTPNDWADIHRKCHIPMRQIWQLVRRIEMRPSVNGTPKR
jgi:hypothetical protein